LNHDYDCSQLTFKLHTLRCVGMTFGPGLCDAIACAVALLAAHDLKDFLAQAGPLDEVHTLPADARAQVTSSYTVISELAVVFTAVGDDTYPWIFPPHCRSHPQTTGAACDASRFTFRRRLSKRLSQPWRTPGHTLRSSSSSSSSSSRLPQQTFMRRTNMDFFAC